MFRALCAHQEVKIVLYNTGIVTPAGGHPGTVQCPPGYCTSKSTIELNPAKYETGGKTSELEGRV